MTTTDTLKTRIIVAKSLKISPDSIDVPYKGVDGIYAVPYKGYTFVVGFAKVPTIEEARELLKNLYLGAMEMEFDEEMED